VSSRSGLLTVLKNNELKQSFTDPNLTVHALSALVERFVTAAAEGVHQEQGWPNSAYAVSKLAVTALSRVLARDYPMLFVAACCPGWFAL